MKGGEGSGEEAGLFGQAQEDFAGNFPFFGFAKGQSGGELHGVGVGLFRFWAKDGHSGETHA